MSNKPKYFIFVFSLFLLLTMQSTFAQYGRGTAREEAARAQINLELKSKFGDNSYEASDVTDVDFRKGNYKFYFTPLEDPYGTLANCFIFTTDIDGTGINGISAYGKYCLNMVGVYKNGSIIWLSKPEISDGNFGYLLLTGDLNNDGNVEIITEWNTGRQHSALWIYSWNGSAGWRINATGAPDDTDFPYYSALQGVERTWGYFDKEGDGIWEIKNYYDEDKKGNAIYETYSWNGSEYGRWANTPKYTRGEWLPRNNMQVKVNCKVTKDYGEFEYNYKVENLSVSKQRISTVYVQVKTDSFTTQMPNNDWKRRLNTPFNVDGWEIKAYGGKGYIERGKSLNGFIKKSKALPIIGKYFIRADNAESSRASNSSVKYDIGHNSVIGSTIGISDPPNPFTTLGFIDTLMIYTDSSYALGWITNEQTRDKYDNYFNNAKNYLQQNNNNAAKSELQKVLTDCNTDSSTVLTSEAYALLYFNTEYLLTKIEDGGITPIENSLSGSVNVTLTNADSINTFGYTITNSDTSKQAIKNIYIENTASIQSVNLPDGWTNIAGANKFNLIGFKSQSEGILSGTEQSGFNVSANGLPTIGNVYLQSQRNNVDSADIFENSFIAETLVPTSKPETFNPNQFVDTLIYYNNKSLSNNWLTAEWVKNVFESSLNNAKLFINQKLYTSAVPVMQQLITILDSYKTSGFVKEEAYYLLKINSQYLLAQLNVLAVTPPAEAVAQLDSVFAANELNKTNSWYSAEWVYTVLTSILNNAKTTLNQNNLAGTKLIIEQFVITLDSYKTSGFITAEGYNNIKPKCVVLIEMLQ